MSLLNQLFNRGILGAKCKTCLNLAISRIKLLQNKRDVQLKLMRKEIAQFLQAGQEAIARIRVEHVIREQNIWGAYEILEMFCESVLARVPILESQRTCPSDMREAIASLIFAAPRCSDLPDLLHLRNLFAAKYGKEFVAAASELRPDTSVNRTIIEKLSIHAPSSEVKLKVLREIAQEFSLEWDSSKTEAEFSKKPEDLLNGPKQVSGDTLPQSPSKHVTQENLPFNKKARPIASSHGNGALEHHGSPTPGNLTPLPHQDGSQSSAEHDSTVPVGGSRNEARPQSLDVLERAKAAIAAAERATAAARAAAQLASVSFSVPVVGESMS